MSHSQTYRRTKLNNNNALSSTLSAAGGLIAKHPSIVGGATAFIIIFSFVSANALYYQKGSHPAPILDMRGPQNLTGSTSSEPNIRAINTVQNTGSERTFRVQHQDGIKTASVKLPDPAVAPKPIAQGRQVPAIAAEIKNDASNDLVQQIQSELAKQKLYLNEIDGLMGPNTRAAIETFQKENGLIIDGVASAPLLARMQQKTKKPDSIVSIVGADRSQAEQMVRLIQVGLSQSAYPHIQVDGVVGEQTAEAIRQFEQHYRLPVTGEPNQNVLDKLKAIGAF